jgi:PPOX class probable F420-dependent enzyme
MIVGGAPASLPALPSAGVDRGGIESAAMSRRDQIKLSEAELLELLEGERVAIVSSNGPRGFPHSMPLWYVPREGEIWIWTYAKSQKVRNLERDPRATVLVETGHEYGELRGAMIEAEAEIHRDAGTVLGFAEELTVRYAKGIDSVEGDAKAALEAQAPKRVAIHFKPLRVATWDHRKLGGTY